MREIKFRAWYEDKMWSAFDMQDAEWELCSLFQKSHQLNFMQFTGLTDKNGVDIYEGDIVIILYTDWPSQSRENNGRYAISLDEYRDSISNIGKVVFKDAEFCIQFNDDGYTSSIHCGIHGQIKVIGNIHENKELLAQGG